MKRALEEAEAIIILVVPRQITDEYKHITKRLKDEHKYVTTHKRKHRMEVIQQGIKHIRLQQYDDTFLKVQFSRFLLCWKSQCKMFHGLHRLNFKNFYDMYYDYSNVSMTTFFFLDCCKAHRIKFVS